MIWEISKKELGENVKDNIFKFLSPTFVKNGGKGKTNKFLTNFFLLKVFYWLQIMSINHLILMFYFKYWN